jgi:hypothetical protein
MNASPKSTKEDPAAGKAEAPEMFLTTFAGMFHRGVERTAGLHKAMLDTFVQQTTDVNHAFRDTLRNLPMAPAMAMLDVGEEMMGRLVEADKNITDVLVKQSAHMVDLSKERTNSVSRAAVVARDLFRETAESGIAVQKIVLDLAAEGNKAVTQTVKSQNGVAGTPLFTAADNFGKGVGTVIETQKEILEVAAKPLKASAKA